METPNMDTLCKVYVKIRSKKQEIQKAADEQIAALDVQLSQVAAAMKDFLVSAGVNSMKTDHGTAFIQAKTKYYAMDWEVFGNWIIANKAVNLLEKRVAQTNMKQWMEECPSNPPPGMQAETELSVTVRKS